MAEINSAQGGYFDYVLLVGEALIPF